MHLSKSAIGSVVALLAMAGVAAGATANAGVGVDVSTPNVRVQVDAPVAPTRVTVVEKERGGVRKLHDRGKHKGHYKRHKGHK